MDKNSKVITIHGQQIRMWPTDWQFRRSNGDDLDIDLFRNIAPPGHFILFKNDKDGNLVSQRTVEYISRTEGLGPKLGDKPVRSLYLVDDDIVWCGPYHMQEKE